MAANKEAPTVLFIDDDVDLACALSSVLQQEGYRVRHAADGEIGVKMAAQQRPDVILLDFMMPTKNGFEACRELRQLDGLANVPIVAMTAFGQNIGGSHGLGLGENPDVQDYLEKPIEFNVLLERLATVLAASTD